MSFQARKLIPVAILFVSVLACSVYAAPAPWGIAINEKAGECAGYWAGDEYGNNPLPEGWNAFYPWSAGWDKLGDVSECYLNSTNQGPYFTNDSRICCERHGYAFVSKNIGWGRDSNNITTNSTNGTSQEPSGWNGTETPVLIAPILIVAIVLAAYLVHRRSIKGA